jgi:hypothetical protein
MRRFWIALLSTTAACGACGEDAPPPPRFDGDASVVDLAPDVTNEELFTIWKRAAGDLAVEDGQPASLRYQVPSCPLRYAVRSRHLNEVAKGREPAGVETVAEVTATPSGETVAWQVVKHALFALHDEDRSEQKVPRADTSPAIVKTDGIVFREDGGPTALWAAHTSLPPLHWFYPTLPKESAVGSTSRWTIVTYAKTTGGKGERTRDPNAMLANMTPSQQAVEVTLASWQRIASTPAAVLGGAWNVIEETTSPMKSERVERWRARWVVLDNGRVLHAIAAAGTYHAWTTGADENSKLGSAELELRLVEACDGPVLQGF